MPASNKRWVGLIRGIGANTHKVMSMAQLREGCAAAGFDDVNTVLATGNVLFTTRAPKTKVLASLRRIVADHGLDNAVFLRDPKALRDAIDRNPFEDAAIDRPSHLLVLFTERTIERKATAALAAYEGPERIQVSGREVFLDYAKGIGRSKLTPSVLERALGQPGTARNLNTVHKLIAAAS